MLSSVSRSMHMAFFLIDMTERPTSMQPCSFPFFSCEEKTPMSASPHVSGRRNDSLHARGNTYVSCPLGILQNAFVQHKVSLGGKKSHEVKKSASESSFLWSPSTNRFIAPFGYTTVKNTTAAKCRPCAVLQHRHHIPLTLPFNF